MDNPQLTELKERMNNEVANNANVTEAPATNNSKQFARKEKPNHKVSPLFNTEWSKNVPAETRNLIYILRNNVDIRRYTAMGIINYLLQKGEIKGEKRYVNFFWNKFRVVADGFVKEYKYNETFFLNCFVASFASFSAVAQKTINMFCKAEMSMDIDKAVNTDEVNEIIQNNEQYVANDKNIDIND